MKTTVSGLIILIISLMLTACGGSSGGSDTPSATAIPPLIADTQAPSIPVDLVSSAITDKSVSISWGASTDNTAVKGYEVYRDGVKLGDVTTTSYSDSGLSGSTTSSYEITAYDAANNMSAKSTSLSVITLVTPPHVLAGKWFGTVEGMNEVLSTMTLVINDEGNVTEAIIEGNTTSSTSALTLIQSDLPLGASAYKFYGINAVEGILIVDDTNSHMTFLDRDTRVAVLEKGASELPVFTLAEGAGDFVMIGMYLSNKLTPTTIFTANYSMMEDGATSATNSQGDELTGSTLNLDTEFGRSQGTLFNKTANVNFTTSVFSSADKLFSATYGCQEGSSYFIYDCYFGFNIPAQQ